MLAAGAHSLAKRAQMRTLVTMQLGVTDVRRIEYGFGSEEGKRRECGSLLCRQLRFPEATAFAEKTVSALEHRQLGDSILVAGSRRAARSVEPLLYRRQVRQSQLELDHLTIANGIDGTHDMRDVFILEAAHDVNYRVSLADVRKKLVTESLAFGGSFHEPGNVDELYYCRYSPLRLYDVRQPLETIVGHFDHPDVRLHGTKGVIGRLGLRRCERIEQCGLSDVGKSNDAELQHSLLALEGARPLVVRVHCPLHSLSDPRSDRPFDNWHESKYLVSLVARERSENEVGEIVIDLLPLLARTNADPETRIFLIAQRDFDASQPVVSACTSTRTNAKPADWQRDVVDNDQHVARGGPERTAKVVLEYLSAEVHVRERLDEPRARPTNHHVRDKRIVIALPSLEMPNVGEVVEYPPADVVPCRLVLTSWIAEPENHLQRLSPDYFSVPSSSSVFLARMTSGSAGASASSAGTASTTARGAETTQTDASSSPTISTPSGSVMSAT